MSDRTPLDRADNPVTLEDWQDRCEFLEREMSNFRRNASARAEEIARAEVSSLESQLKQAQADLAEIAKVVNVLPSVTHGPVSDKGGIIFAIRDLQECYGDAARARNGSYTKMQARAEAAESRLQAVTEAHRWIPVEEKLPQRFGNVFVAHTETSSNTPAVEEAQLIADDPKWCLVRTGLCDDAIYLDQQVTHWQPLPMPPTEPTEKGKCWACEGENPDEPHTC
jgi:hypothetical protein